MIGALLLKFAGVISAAIWPFKYSRARLYKGSKNFCARLTAVCHCSKSWNCSAAPARVWNTKGM